MNDSWRHAVKKLVRRPRYLLNVQALKLTTIADHVQIAALTKALKLNIQVAYLDGHSEEVNFVDFQSVPPVPNENPSVLLYRYARIALRE